MEWNLHIYNSESFSGFFLLTVNIYHIYGSHHLQTTLKRRFTNDFLKIIEMDETSLIMYSLFSFIMIQIFVFKRPSWPNG